MVSSARFDEDDRVADLETGRLGTVNGVVRMIHHGEYQRAYLVWWDGAASATVVRGDTVRAAADGPST